MSGMNWIEWTLADVKVYSALCVYVCSSLCVHSLVQARARCTMCHDKVHLHHQLPWSIDCLEGGLTPSAVWEYCSSSLFCRYVFTMALPNTESTNFHLTLSSLYLYVRMTSIHIRPDRLYCVCMWWIDCNCIDLNQLILLQACTIPCMGIGDFHAVPLQSFASRRTLSMHSRG